jgi:hypothetical protein
MKAQHIWEIPDQGGTRGGDLYDVNGNLDYFASTDALTDKTSTGVDKQITVKAHTSSRFMRDPAPFQVSSHTYERSYGGGQSKGALPGYKITLVSDAGLPNEEIRQFQYTGTLSALSAWLVTTAKMQVALYGPKGSLNALVPAASAG